MNNLSDWRYHYNEWLKRWTLVGNLDGRPFSPSRIISFDVKKMIVKSQRLDYRLFMCRENEHEQVRYIYAEIAFEDFLPSKEYANGMLAFNLNLEPSVQRRKNPYIIGTKMHEDWECGLMFMSQKRLIIPFKI